MSKVLIGKHTLESLTSGMYSDPYVVFREYIQNAVDSIDEAVEAGVINYGEEKIEISIYPLERKIIISDNGIGLCEKVAEKSLISIGNSRKSLIKSRGFRGIGRLSALSYCKSIIFETTYKGEPVGTRVSFDAEKLSSILADADTIDISVMDVLSSICTTQQYKESVGNHYFNVTLIGIDDSSNLMNFPDVLEYISQTAPVPYNPKDFSWGKEILQRLRQYNYILPQYNISVICGIEKIDIFKPYKNHFLIDRNKNIYDSIQDISIHEIKNSDNGNMALVWVAKTNNFGTILDRQVKGLRIRKGNILVGDNQTANIIFKDARFNGWVIGEVFAFDPKLLPNARRDNFEKNPAYFMLIEQLTTIAINLTREIRTASLSRNADLANAVQNAESISNKVKKALSEDIALNTKSTITQKMNNAQKTLENLKVKNDTEGFFQEIAFEELDILIGKVRGATAYKALNTLSSLTKTEKVVLERVLRTIYSNLTSEESQKIIDLILQEFSLGKN